MIPPNQGSSLFQDSSLNRTPRENCYISGYNGSNENFEDVIERAWTAISMVEISNPEDKTVKRGISYKFDMVNSPELSHCGKTSISPNW